MIQLIEKMQNYVETLRKYVILFNLGKTQLDLQLDSSIFLIHQYYAKKQSIFAINYY